MTARNAWLIPIALCLFTGCERDAQHQSRDALSSGIGRSCVVQFRRDALGVAGSHVIPPQGSDPKMTESEIRGTLSALEGHYLILRQEKTTIWVPESSILLVRFEE